MIEVNQLKKGLARNFQAKELDLLNTTSLALTSPSPEWYIIIWHIKYVLDILKETNIMDCKTVIVLWI